MYLIIQSISECNVRTDFFHMFLVLLPELIVQSEVVHQTQ